MAIGHWTGHGHSAKLPALRLIQDWLGKDEKHSEPTALRAKRRSQPVNQPTPGGSGKGLLVENRMGRRMGMGWDEMGWDERGLRTREKNLLNLYTPQSNPGTINYPPDPYGRSHSTSYFVDPTICAPLCSILKLDTNTDQSPQLRSYVTAMVKIRQRSASDSSNLQFVRKSCRINVLPFDFGGPLRGRASTSRPQTILYNVNTEPVRQMSHSTVPIIIINLVRGRRKNVRKYCQSHIEPIF
ncbi:hypothetical protein HYALB_00011625 [Hymenoscyphus albidus]|uniref:Uncharacterized protein n=1 Tax=Hymenoscyphus albidus TaxID=595503 RepID=A0A9N9Q461_9HELO|nr:hypothetical protein HYALB_00011625 [Hymenoscyphus albidus]